MGTFTDWTGEHFPELIASKLDSNLFVFHKITKSRRLAMVGVDMWGEIIDARFIGTENCAQDYHQCVIDNWDSAESWYDNSVENVMCLADNEHSVVDERRYGKGELPDRSKSDQDNELIEPAAPREPGCYVWMPNGCLRHEEKEQTYSYWHLDLRAMTSIECMGKRKQDFDRYCGNEGIRMLWIPDPTEIDRSEEQQLLIGGTHTKVSGRIGESLVVGGKHGEQRYTYYH